MRDEAEELEEVDSTQLNNRALLADSVEGERGGQSCGLASGGPIPYHDGRAGREPRGKKVYGSEGGEMAALG